MRRLCFGGAVTLVMALALVGCGSRATTQISATATTPASMTTTPAATSGSFAPTLATVAPAPTSHAGSFAACGQSSTSSSTVGVPVSLLDGMTVTASTPMGNLAMPQTRIPNGTPLAPYKLTNNISASFNASAVQVNPRTDAPGGGYVLTLCNTSGHTRRIDAVRVAIASATPYTGSLATWVFCSNIYDAAQHTASNEQCGGSDIENNYMRAAFASNAGVGATAAATMVSVSPVLRPVLGPLPVSLAPNQMMSIEVGVTAPTAPATYTFSFALAVDGAAPRTVAISQPTLLAPVTQAWTGDNCQTSAMLAEMPTSGQYVCPPAS